MKKLIIGQSGGPTAVINSSLYGAVVEAQKNSDKISEVLGMVNGIEGLLADNVISLDREFKDKDMSLLKQTPAAFLGSCRYKLPSDFSDSVYELIFSKLKQMDVGYFLYIGGNDSMDTVSKLSAYAETISSDIKFMGIPKTIDNDLVLTDHTPGYGSAARYVATTVREIIYDAEVYKSPSVTIVEIMGRHAGWLTASSLMARQDKTANPLIIALPEVSFSVEKFVDKVKELLKTHANVIVCVSEGIKDENGKYICEYEQGDVKLDSFGHTMLSGCGKYLEGIIGERLHVKVRSVELNVCQRASVSLASATDIEEASNAGKAAVDNIIKGATNSMISFKRVSDKPYKINYELENVNKICNKEKPFPVEWISQDGFNIKDEFLDYALPLVKGSIDPVLDEYTLPAFIKRS